MDKVLVVTYHFPPSGGSKTRRTLKFLKFLPQFHWTPIVLTTKTGMRFGFDPSLVELVPKQARVHRAFDLSALLKAVLPASDNGRSAPGTNHTRRTDSWKKTFRQLCRQVLSWVKKWTAIPDIFVFVWAPFALYSGVRAITREDANVIYSTGPPFSSHIVGVLIKKLTRKPLIVDFRDAWTANPVRRMKYPIARHSIESMVEKFVIQNADTVVSTTEGITHDFRNRYGGGGDKKFITLPNGYDREEFSLPDKTENGRPRKMRIVHTGFLRLERSPKPLLTALRQLFDENPGMEEELEVYLIGEAKTFLDGRTIEDYLQELRLETVVKLIGHVPQPEAIQYQMSADILLLVIGVVPPEEVSTYGIASKVFDYMIAGRPVLALADPGPVRELVEKTEIGPAFAPADIQGIKDYLLQALLEFRVGRLEVKSNKAEIERYDFRELTGQLVQQFFILTHRNTF
jgi:glycosyltransferase involved in cell wall biosynthesis